MPTTLTWLGHGTWLIQNGAHRALLDPFLTDSPTAPVTADQIETDLILISHGHSDHVADAATIAVRTGATIIANYEICEWLGRQGIEKTHAMNLGGTCRRPLGAIKMTLAHHSSMLPDGSYGGNPCGYLLGLPEGNVYFACDTALFYDMKLIGESGLELAVLPIGDNFTMGPDDAVRAVQLLKPRRVVPVHVNTWPIIEQDVHAWANRVRAVTAAEPVVLAPGESLTL
ncbi:MAG: metal-dependent hydrolase [Pirellulales bacterium]|nr:metal-dependent hydrolase [Pirellulales bacterium]